MAVFNFESSCFFLLQSDRMADARAGFLANTYKKLSLQKFWFPVFWNEKGIGCNSRTVPATVNRNKSFCKQPLSKTGRSRMRKSGDLPE